MANALITGLLPRLGVLPWVKLIDNFDAEYEYVTNEGTLFTFKTNLDAPRYRLINIDFASPAQSSWKELIPQHEKDVIGEPPQHSRTSCYGHIRNLCRNVPLNFFCDVFLWPRVARSVRHLYVLQLPVCVFPPRREERVEDVPSELGGGAEDLPSGCRLRCGFHRQEEGL